MFNKVKWFLTILTIATAREVSDAELYRLPKLFHLDDYERCLSQEDGVYCVGTFELSPKTENNSVFSLIQEHLKQPFSFDRRLLHRGYCLSTRCPSKEHNTTLRFEQCVDKLLHRYPLKARIKTLSYCRNHAEFKSRAMEAPDLPQRIFLYVVYFILSLNIVGTLHDMYTDGKSTLNQFNQISHFWNTYFICGNGCFWEFKLYLTTLLTFLLHFLFLLLLKGFGVARFVHLPVSSLSSSKNKLLLAWSLPSNWKRLTATDENTSTFALIHSSKIILYSIIIYSHSHLLYYISYVYNPEVLQRIGQTPLHITIRNGTSLVQVFVLISSFFTGYDLLYRARRSTVNVGLVARMMLKRIFRIAPVYLLLTAYSATWWPRAGDGPLWSPMVEAESGICRKKFWTHVFFVNNFVEAPELCMVQSWAMAAEIQLFMVSMLLTILFLKLRVRAVPILGAMFTASCLFNITLAYAADLVPMFKIIVPEKMRVIFRGCSSFFHLHMSPWSNFPACLFGLLLAHMYFEQQNKKIKYKTEKLNTDSTEHGEVKKSNEQINENRTAISENDGTVSESNQAVCENNGPVSENSSTVKESEERNGLEFSGNGIRNRKYVTEGSRTNGVDKTATPLELETKSNGVNKVDKCEESKKSNGTTFGNQNASNLVEKEKQRQKKVPFLLRYAHFFTMPFLLLWVVLGSHIENVDSKLVIAIFVGMERLMFSLMFAWQLLQLLTVRGPWGRLLSWQGWTVPGRLALSVVMVHWCVNVTIVAARPQPVASSTLHVSMDWLATLFYSYLIALPINLLVELPMKKSLDVFIS